MASLLNLVMKISHGSEDFTAPISSFYALHSRRLAASADAPDYSFEQLRGQVVLVVNVASA
jgi:hypothetical protein